MTSFRRAAGVLSAATLAAAGLLAAGTSAQAANASGTGTSSVSASSVSASTSASASASGTKAEDCPAGYICFWDAPDMTGDFMKFRDAGAHEFPVEFRNRMSSYENNTGQCVKGWDWVDWAPDYGVLLVDETGGDLSYPHDAGGTFDNRLDEVNIGGCP